jgi:Protein of unknown function (DUF3185)
MANNSFSATKIIGLVLTVAGLGLAYWGYHLSGSYGSQIARAVTGSVTNEIMTYYIAGGASFVVGLYLFITK